MVRIDEPFHGAVLNRRHGRSVNGGLAVRVTGEAPLAARVTVNGAVADRQGRRFSTEALLTDPETDIIAASEDSTGVSRHAVRVVWDRRSRPRYRFTIDDNSFFLRDIAANAYTSLFDCFFLSSLRDLNVKYGAKFSLNLFYATPEDDFNLSQFPATYRREWLDNSDWLKLAFHARAEFPNRPYQHVGPGRLAEDYDLVAEHIRRFAGAATFSPATVVHWAMVHPSALSVLQERGVRALTGIFKRTIPAAADAAPCGSGPLYDLNYCLDDRRSAYLACHDALKDFGTGIVFSKVDVICNNTPLDRVVPTLAPLVHHPQQAEIMDLLTHEQYFWPFYHNHVPDHVQRCERAIRFCADNGYEPVFFHEGLLGAL